MTTAIWFDLDGTLLQYDRSFEAMFEESLAAVGVDEVPETAFDEYTRRLFDAVDGCENDIYRLGFDAVEASFELGIDPETAAEEYVERELESATVVDGAKAVLESVGERAEIGILTNGDAIVQRQKIERQGLDDLVDATIVSGEAGVRKPDPAAFDLAKERLPADEYVFVGDEYETDVVPAGEAGFRAVHVRNDDGPAVSVNGVGSIATLLFDR